MHFVGVTTPGGPSNLSVMVAPVPMPKDGEVLIKVHAAGSMAPIFENEREGTPCLLVRLISWVWRLPEK